MSAMTHQIDRLGAGRRVDDSEAFAAGRPARRSPAGGLTPKRTLTATQRAAVDGLAERLGL
jgi:hypothetical protein